MSYVTELKATYSHVDSQRLSDGLRIMTSNVLNQNDPTSLACPLDYKERAEILSFYYRYFKADSIGLQEVTRDFLCELLSHLEDEYAYLDVDTHGSKNYTPIIYRKALYNVVESGFVHFAVRGCWSCEYGVFESKADPCVKYAHMNLHYHFATTETRMPGALDAHAMIKTIRENHPDMPVFITGDYNCGVSTPEYQAMVNGLPLTTGFLMCEDNAGDRSLWHRLGKPEAVDETEEEIDHVVVTHDKVKVIKHRRVADGTICRATDHYPVFIDAVLI